MTFKVGDVVEVLRSIRGFAGVEGTVVEIDCVADIEPEKTVRVEHVHGKYRYSAHNLRLKRPPSEYDGNQAGDWDLIPWRPSTKKELS